MRWILLMIVLTLAGCQKDIHEVRGPAPSHPAPAVVENWHPQLA